MKVFKQLYQNFQKNTVVNFIQNKSHKFSSINSSLPSTLENDGANHEKINLAE